jgi:outer membrane lipoprotein LolB
MDRLAAVFVLALALVLGGCASTPRISPTDIRASVSDSWSMQGRIGIRTGDQNLSGLINWKHRTDMDEMVMTSPLGQGVARIVRDLNGVTLELPNQPAHHAPDAEALTREVLGYGLPVSGLSWWMQARPAPNRECEVKRDVTGRIAQLKQDGWVIDYLQYADDAPARPRKLVVARDGLEIRLVTDAWQDE